MQIEKVYEPQRFEPHWAQWWIDSGIFRASAKAPAARLFARHSAAQRHRLAAHRSHARAHRNRCHHPLASHARRQHAVAAGHRSRRHRHANGGGAQTRRRGHRPPRPGPRRVRKARLGVEGRVRRHHQAPDDPPGRKLRLVAASASPSIPASRAPCAKSSSACTKRASSTAASTWSTGARAATPRSPIWKWRTPTCTATCGTSATP